MKFFLPHASSPEEAESVLSGICEFVGAAVPAKRIHMLRFTHNGKEYSVEVGKPAPGYYFHQAEGEEVIAIIPGEPYKICTPNRGVLRGEPIMVGQHAVISAWHFD